MRYVVWLCCSVHRKWRRLCKSFQFQEWCPAEDLPRTQVYYQLHPGQEGVSLLGFLTSDCSLICFVGIGVASCSVCLGLDVVLG